MPTLDEFWAAIERAIEAYHPASVKMNDLLTRIAAARAKGDLLLLDSLLAEHPEAHAALRAAADRVHEARERYDAERRCIQGR